MVKLKVLLVLNGEPFEGDFEYSVYDKIVATDGAVHFLLDQGIRPNWVSGDFDSLENKPLGIDFKCTPDQNYTDFEKALHLLIEEGIDAIDVLNASGGEVDHFLGNISTLVSFKERLKIRMLDHRGQYFLATKKVKLKVSKNKIVSLIPLFKVDGISTKGLEYPLNNETLIFGNRIGTRNKSILETIEISHNNGDLLIYIEH